MPRAYVRQATHLSVMPEVVSTDDPIDKDERAPADPALDAASSMSALLDSPV